MKMSNCLVRQMQSEDCSQVAAIDKASIQNAWTENDFKDAVNQQQQYYWVALKEHKIVGFVGMLVAADEADITHIAVQKEYRRQHIAFALLQELICQASELGVGTIYLEVRRNNSSAQRFYQAMNFEEVGVRKNYYTNPKEDAIIMKKTISPSQ